MINLTGFRLFLRNESDSKFFVDFCWKNPYSNSRRITNQQNFCKYLERIYKDIVL